MARRFVTLYRRQGSRPFPRKRNAKRQNGCLRRTEKRRSERQRRKRKIYPFECRVPKDSKERYAFLSDQSKEIEENNRMGKTVEISSRKLGNISCKDGHNKVQKWYGPNRSRTY